jgi:hypothetical protein
MFTFKEAIIVQINSTKQEKEEFFNRSGFGHENTGDNDDYISLDQMVA